MKRLFGFAAYSILSVAAVAALAGSAAAQSLDSPAAPAVGVSIATLVLGLVAASAPGIFIGLWGVFKAHAASSAAKWDDEAVALVEKIAQGVVDKKSAPLAGQDH